MPPNLTPQEIAALKKELALAQAGAESFTAQIAGQNSKAAEYQLQDDAFKKFFDYYNDDIIGKYDLEYKSLKGDYIASPIVEADIQASGNLAPGRITPIMPATDVVRIAEFDGAPLINTNVNEQQHILAQADAENHLVNGYSSTPYSGTLTTTTNVTPASTTLSLSDSAVPITIVAGEVFLLNNGSDLAVVKVDSIALIPGGPPFVANLNITLLVPPSGTINSGENLDNFAGFTNAERAIKTPTDSTLQPLMNYLVAELQAKINLRKARLAEQLSYVTTNQDPYAVSQLAATATNINISNTFLTNYLITTDVSNTGITSLVTERGIRSSQITTRLSQITFNYTGQTENFYNQRYSMANSRGSTQRGTIRLHSNALAVAGTSANFASSLTAQANSIAQILA